MINTDLTLFLIAPLVAGVAAKFIGWRFLAALSVVVAGALLLHGYGILHRPPGFGFDVAMIHNALWNLSEGRGVWSDLLDQSLYSVHAFFNLPLFLPFFLVSPRPEALNLAHFIFGIAPVIPLFYLGGKTVGLSFALIYLLLPATSGFLLVEAQPSITGVVFLAAYLYFKESRKLRPAAACAALAAFGYEPFLLAIILEGLLELPSNRRWGAVILTIGLATLALFLLNASTGPSASGSRHYQTLGGSPVGAVKMLFFAPRELIALVFMKAKIGYLFHLLFPLLFLPLLAPRALLIALPELALVLLADPGDDMYKINAFYSHVTTIAFLYAAIRATARFANRERVAVFLVVNALVCHFAYDHTLLKRKVEPVGISEIVELVPRGAIVVTESREDVVKFPFRRVSTPDDFLSPRVYEQWREGALHAEYLALPASVTPEASRTAQGLTARRFTFLGNDAGLDIYRAIP